MALSGLEYGHGQVGKHLHPGTLRVSEAAEGRLSGM